MTNFDTLRLLLLEQCNRDCELCCNKNQDLPDLEIADKSDYINAKVICLTGGEPMLRPGLIRKAVAEIRECSDAKIILYTAKTDNFIELQSILEIVDGMTITLHEQSDVNDLKNFMSYCNRYNIAFKSLRINIFKNIEFELPETRCSIWTIKDNIEWIPDCPLLDNEVFKRYGVK